MAHLKFDLAKLERLNDPGRFETLIPGAMWEALGEPADARVIIEVGAGTGLFAAEFAARAPQATVYAADLEPSMVAWMSENRPETASGRLVPLLSEESHVPLEDGIADVVVMINLHHELAEPEASYRDVVRLLAPGGRLLAVDWAHRETPKGPPMAVRISAEEASAFLARAGLTDVRAHDTLPWHWMVTGVRR